MSPQLNCFNVNNFSKSHTSPSFKTKLNFNDYCDIIKDLKINFRNNIDLPNSIFPNYPPLPYSRRFEESHIFLTIVIPWWWVRWCWAFVRNRLRPSCPGLRRWWTSSAWRWPCPETPQVPGWTARGARRWFDPWLKKNLSFLVKHFKTINEKLNSYGNILKKLMKK